MDELEARRKQLFKALEQGEKMANLQAVPEWEWFKGWIESLRDAAQNAILSEDFVNNHDGYLKALGAYQAYNSIIVGSDKFATAQKIAGQRLQELEEANG